MTWSKAVTIWCDGDDCEKWKRPGTHRVGAARDTLSDRGWTHRDGNDYCPECSTEKTEVQESE